MGFPPGYRLSVREGAPWCHDRQPSPRGPKLPRLAFREALPGLATMAREVTCTRQAPGNRTARAFPCQPQRVRGCRLHPGPQARRESASYPQAVAGLWRDEASAGIVGLWPFLSPPVVTGFWVSPLRAWPWRRRRRRASPSAPTCGSGPPGTPFRSCRLLPRPPTIGFPAGAESCSHTGRDVRSTPARREQ